MVACTNQLVLISRSWDIPLVPPTQLSRGRWMADGRGEGPSGPPDGYPQRCEVSLVSHYIAIGVASPSIKTT